MFKLIMFTSLFVLSSVFLFGHESGKSLVQQVGSFHLIILHFPIALIIMTAISEYLFRRTLNPIYDHAARFMLVSAAITALPTAIFGLIYSYAFTYADETAKNIFWHMWLGIVTAIFAIAVAYIREYKGISGLYYFSLLILFVLVNVTAYFGGVLTFGPLF